MDGRTLIRFSCKSEKMRAFDDKVDLIIFNQKENKAFKELYWDERSGISKVYSKREQITWFLSSTII